MVDAYESRFVDVHLSRGVARALLMKAVLSCRFIANAYESCIDDLLCSMRHTRPLMKAV